MKPSELIDRQIAGLADWRGERMAALRKVILSAASGITEEWKWNTGVWAKNKPVCALGAFKDHVKINFFNGALITDEHHLFNSGLEAKKSRSIDLYEHDELDDNQLRDLIRAALQSD